MQTDQNVFIHKPDVSRRTTLSLPTIWREQRAGRFPPYTKLSAGRVALRAADLDAWLAGRRDWSDEAGQ
jgi:prophage regulatory protein